jgi:hypothetical protein
LSPLAVSQINRLGVSILDAARRPDWVRFVVRMRETAGLNLSKTVHF